MTIVFTRFDLGKQGFDKDINDVTVNDILMLPNMALHRADTVLFHDTAKTGNYKILKHRGDSNVNYHNLVINKYNKGVLIDLLTNWYG